MAANTNSGTAACIINTTALVGLGPKAETAARVDDGSVGFVDSIWTIHRRSEDEEEDEGEKLAATKAFVLKRIIRIFY